MDSPTKEQGEENNQIEGISISDTATCEACGKVGPRITFHSTTKRFCTPTCSHSFSARHRQYKRDFAAVRKKRKSEKFILPTEMERQELITQGFDWGAYLTETNSVAATVNLFSHAPMAAYWADIGPGVKVEVLNLDCPLNNVYWIAEVVQVAGYKAKLRYEGFEEDSSHDFWCNLCTLDIHAVGWCATIGKPLVPPTSVQDKNANWKSYLVKRLTGAKTLPADFQDRVIESIQSQFKTQHRLEVMDKEQISQMRIGIIEEIRGRRLRIRYEDSPVDSKDHFWCHSQSNLIHPMGWSERIGHKLYTVDKENRIGNSLKNCKSDIFKHTKPMKATGFKLGYKLEAIDPLNLSAICPATVKKVLRYGYIMIGIDGSEAAEGTDWFCCHCTSPSIFPVGFCEANGIEITPPKDDPGFNWPDYMKQTSSQAVAAESFTNDSAGHGFEVGMKLEAVDLMEPRLICISTVKRVVGRMLRIHFDGWEEDYDQWIDSQSPDIYPVGWCELVGYDLQPPADFQSSISEEVPKKKIKGHSFLTKKKKKRVTKTSKANNDLEIGNNEEKCEQKSEDVKMNEDAN